MLGFPMADAQHLKPDLIAPDLRQIVLAPMVHHRCWCYRLLFG